MALSIWIIKGKDEGYRFQVKPGLSIGRKRADIVINDAKISSVHAEFRKINDKIYLVDLGSSNKIQHQNKTIDSLHLTDGLKFYLGDTYFEVVEEFEDEPNHWAGKLKQLIKKLGQESPTKRNLIYPFPRTINLKFIRGVMLDKEFQLEYGPRIIGVNNIDIKLDDWLSESENIEFFKLGNDIYVKLLEDKDIIVNGKAYDEKKIDSGDIIQIGENQLKVSI